MVKMLFFTMMVTFLDYQILTGFFLFKISINAISDLMEVAKMEKKNAKVDMF